MSAGPIIDAHHHVWRLERTPWLAGSPVPRIFGDYEPLRRDYLVEEFAADARPCGVVGSVYVQVNVAPGEEVEEVAWVAQAGAEAGLMQGIVSFADLRARDVGDVLDRQLAAGPVRGVRQQLHWHENPAYRFAERPDAMLERDFRRGLSQVGGRGLLFELQVFPGQYEDALKVVDRFSDMTFVLLHAGMPDDRSPEGRERWRRGLRRFAERPHVLTKLSGLGTFVRRCTVADWQPTIAEAIDAFGPERCMFGSNFPIEKLWTSYAELVRTFRDSLPALTPAERHHVLVGTAARAYGLAVAELVPTTP